jgi:hypothetical protein
MYSGVTLVPQGYRWRALGYGFSWACGLLLIENTLYCFGINNRVNTLVMCLEINCC